MLEFWEVSFWLTLRRLVLLVLLLFYLLILFVSRTTTHEKTQHFVAERKTVILFFLRRFHSPVKTFVVRFYFVDQLIFLDRLAIMEVFKSVGHAKIHLALRALEILHICQLCFAPLGLAMCSSAIRPTFLISLVLFELALTSFYMLVPDMPRRYAKFGLPFEAQRRLANGAENDIVIILGI